MIGQQQQYAAEYGRLFETYKRPLALLEVHWADVIKEVLGLIVDEFFAGGRLNWWRLVWNIGKVMARVVFAFNTLKENI